ncbi:very-short-patch mismatch repair endonuclease [Streptomyces sp. L-9-10]|uniref:very short patch repair endonuclease n=1 Tax=Streptomyces sp. L-9-10 TaxID=1478131 RepID=UPI00101CF7AA|nr:very short patch repair endonuclease [Streptomyces sp. L-9-10]RYJ31476.1 very-short-patch mismatch repair endonuclease [Streptomyces sp. L-9-10]
MSEQGQLEAPAEQWTPPEGAWASSAANRRSMLGNRYRDTAPELLLRSLVHSAGLRYRVAAKPLPKMRRTADMVFRPVKVAVFIDGCFWHGCPEHFVRPKTNRPYWEDKIGRNIQRDRDTDNRLAEAGWLVLRFWEHLEPEACAATVIEAVATRRQEAEASKHPRKTS